MHSAVVPIWDYRFFMKTHILLLAILLVGMVIGWLCRTTYSHRETTVQRDTVFRYDTIHYSRIELASKTYKIDVPKIGGLSMVLFPINKVDTVYKNKKVYIAMEREYRCTELEGIEIFHSGIDSTIDSLNVVSKTIEIVESYIPRRIRNRVTVGMEAGYLNTFLTPIYLEYERMLHKNVGIYARGSFDMLTQSKGISLGVRANLEW